VYSFDTPVDWWRDDDPSAVANRRLSHAPAGRLSKCAGGGFDLRATFASNNDEQPMQVKECFA
jgi:hypothetical protein